ncbi:hypothetical protein ABBQ38_011206 [Trebouxia sp. C0009 RCD-2024]
MLRDELAPSLPMQHSRNQWIPTWILQRRAASGSEHGLSYFTEDAQDTVAGVILRLAPCARQRVRVARPCARGPWYERAMCRAHVLWQGFRRGPRAHGGATGRSS